MMMMMMIAKHRREKKERKKREKKEIFQNFFWLTFLNSCSFLCFSWFLLSLLYNNTFTSRREQQFL